MVKTTGIIAAGGRGQRLSSLSNTPKALKPIAGHVLLRHTMLRFLKAGLEDIYVLARYQAADFVRYVDAFNEEFRAKVRVVEQSEATYVDSPLNDIVHWLDGQRSDDSDNLFISYCDVITDFDLRRLLDVHVQANGLATMLLFIDDPARFTHKYTRAASGKITSIQSRTDAGDTEQPSYANGGIYLLKPSLLEGYDAKKKIYFSEQDGPMERAFSRQSLYGAAAHPSYFKEIGSIDHFQQCERELLASHELLNSVFGV